MTFIFSCCGVIIHLDQFLRLSPHLTLNSGSSGLLCFTFVRSPFLKQSAVKVLYETVVVTLRSPNSLLVLFSNLIESSLKRNHSIKLRKMNKWVSFKGNCGAASVEEYNK